MQTRSLLVGLVGLVLVAVLPGCGDQERTPEQKKQDPLTPVRSVKCRWASDRIKLDGVINEATWQGAEVLRDFVVWWENRRATTATEARLLWNYEYLYFCAEMEDADLYATIKERNGMTWHNDVFELFFKPSPDSLAYYEFQVTPLNTQLELFLPSRGSGGYDRFAAAPPMGMETVVKLKGTLNQWDDKDKGWTVEGRIPWKAFSAVLRRPQAGMRWRFALCRFDYSVHLERPELSSIAPLTQRDFHRYEDYPELIFVGRGE